MVADLDGVDPDPDPTIKKNTDPDPTLDKHPDPQPCFYICCMPMNAKTCLASCLFI